MLYKKKIQKSKYPKILLAKNISFCEKCALFIKFWTCKCVSLISAEPIWDRQMKYWTLKKKPDCAFHWFNESVNVSCLSHNTGIYKQYIYIHYLNNLVLKDKNKMCVYVSGHDRIKKKSDGNINKMLNILIFLLKTVKYKYTSKYMHLLVSIYNVLIWTRVSKLSTNVYRNERANV